jgi:hypothetical protein
MLRLSLKSHESVTETLKVFPVKSLKWENLLDCFDGRRRCLASGPLAKIAWNGAALFIPLVGHVDIPAFT